MTRKRFKKLLMAEGCSRNEVDLIAAIARPQSYEVAYNEWRKKRHPFANINFEDICGVLDKLVEQMNKVTNAFFAGAVAFNDAFAHAMHE